MDLSAQPLNPDLEPGTLVGEYRVESKIGEGGFGSVFRAVHPVIGKEAAIKVLNREFSVNPEMVERFIAEARAVNQIRHRNIIDIFAFGQIADGRCYYLMELLQGTTLDGHLRDRGRLELGEAIPILRSLARALDAAHAKGIAHRDLKPENVFLTFDEEGRPFPKLLDFGIAKLMGDETAKQYKTRTGAPMGTPAYMSPEQCRGKAVDHRTDIYAFGIMTYELLTGVRPFDGDSFMEIMLKQMSDSPAPPSTLVPELDALFDGPILAMLEKEPDARPNDLASAIGALEQAAVATGAMLPPTGSYDAQRWSSQGRSANTPPPGPVATLPGRAVTYERAVPTESALHLIPSSPSSRTKVIKGDLGSGVESQRPDSLIDSALPPRAGTGALRPRLWIAMASGLVLLVLGVVFWMRNSQPAATLDSNVEQALRQKADEKTQPTPVSARIAPAQDASAAPVVTVDAPPAADTVRVRIDGSPLGAKVQSSDGKIAGVIPFELNVTRSDQAVTLSFENDGFVPETREIVPSADIDLRLELKRRVKKPATPKRPGRDDIESPF